MFSMEKDFEPLRSRLREINGRLDPDEVSGAIDERTRFAEGDIRGIEPRFSPENLPHNLALVELVKSWAERKEAAPGQIALTWLMAQKPWIVPIPGTTQMAHMLQNVGATAIGFTPQELEELNAAVAAIEVRGARLPEAVLAFSGVEAPPKTRFWTRSSLQRVGAS